MRERVVVIGSGLAGLHAACRLVRAEVPTVVVERRAIPGGYCSSIRSADHQFDIGATMLHTPQVLEECFEALGRKAEEYLELIELDPLYEVRFPSGKSLTMRRGVDATAESIAQISPSDGENFLRYASDLSAMKGAMKRAFIERGYPQLERDSWRSILSLARVAPWRSVEQLMNSYFVSSEIRAALSFQTFYLGISPSKCPAVYGMIPFFEVSKGVWYVKGGLGQITKALTQIFIEDGGEVHLNREAERIVLDGQRVCGVRMGDGETLSATRVISNAEATYTLRRLLPTGALGRTTRRRLARSEPSCAPVVTLLSVDAAETNLQQHHTFFMPADMDAVSRSLFELRQMPDEFCCYACYPSLSDDTLAPPGRGALYALTLAPSALGAEWWSANRERFKKHAAKGLMERGIAGMPQDGKSSLLLDPAHYEEEFRQPHGMGFGVRPSASQIGPLRLGPRVSGVQGLYLAGASTNPGGGIPLVLAAGGFAATAALSDMAGRRWLRSGVVKDASRLSL